MISGEYYRLRNDIFRVAFLCALHKYSVLLTLDGVALYRNRGALLRWLHRSLNASQQDARREALSDHS
jgi:hypothetical protein